ncbi:hypothetical protein FRB95_000476 [Tulasnella sp. JGI-2019a]|nr:hypothetical protein FRB95_000476 [Tulasnella sp. JGI-2019a]
MPLCPIPTLPALSDRYRRPCASNVSQDQASLCVIGAFTGARNHLEGKYALPKGWTVCIHPEGDAYFYHHDKRIVTPKDPRDLAAFDIILSAYDRLKKSLYDTARDRIPCSELFLDLSSDKTEVRYYWADHSTCQIFWAEDVPCLALGLPNLTSEREIKSRLTPEYWTHAEYFPIHMPVKQETEDAIVAILRHGCVDNMTSPGSTFPFSEGECQQYIQMLEGFQSLNAAAAQGYRNAVIARIWNAVGGSTEGHRTSTHIESS